MNQFGPKYKTQIESLNAIDKIFFKRLRLRNFLYEEGKERNKNEIKSIDLQISECIKKRARMTKGGFNFIPEEMWSWRPLFSMDDRLLPKILKRN